MHFKRAWALYNFIVGVVEVPVESSVQPSATEVASSPTLKSSSVDEIKETETLETPYMTTVEIGPTLSTTTTNALMSSSSTSPGPYGKILFIPRDSVILSVKA